jgi:hypothetical protein
MSAGSSSGSAVAARAQNTPMATKDLMVVTGQSGALCRGNEAILLGFCVSRSPRAALLCLAAIGLDRDQIR